MFADDRAKAKLNAVNYQIAMSRAVSTTQDFSHPEGLEFLPFQRAGIAYALQRPYVLIADEPGLGKTIQAIGVINADPTIKKILVVCPASITINWAREIQKWCVRAFSGDFATSKYLPDTDIVIANYEIMHKLKDKIQAMQQPFDIHIYDESHRVKNPDALCTQAVLGHETKKNCFPLEARRKLFLTGTPILNRPVELWPMLRVIDSENLGANFWLYAKQFCGGDDQQRGMRDFSGASNLEILAARLRSTLMIRRLKADVLRELPAKRRQIIAIPLPPKAEKVVQRELEFYNNNQAAIEEAIKQAEIAQAVGDKESYIEAAKTLRSAKQASFEELAKLRHDTAVAKIPYVISYLEEALEEHCKIVLFGHHQDFLNPIFEKFQLIAVKLDGNMSSAQKQLSVDRFQTDPKVKLFVASITAAGIGITLTAASYAIFGEILWTPAILSQAEDRLHRIGQHSAVLIQHVCFDCSLDINMAKILISKQEMIEKALGDENG